MKPSSVIVLGAGIVGASIAYHLARQGVQVTVLEQASPGSGVTRHSFAWINPHGEFPAAARPLRAQALADYRRLQHELPALQIHWSGALTYSAADVGAVVAVDTQAVVAWREQILVFNNATLATVVDEINRYRPGMLVLLNKELGQRRVQARFSLQQLAGVALLIRDAYGAKCTELPGGVVLLS